MVIETSTTTRVQNSHTKGTWSDSALRVLKERYLREGETPEKMCWRVAEAIAKAEGENCDLVAYDFYNMIVSRKFMPNSPTLANAGTGNGLQYSACYVIPIEDSVDGPDGIYDAIRKAAVIHQSGGGTGFSFSRLRPSGSPVKKSGGKASGPVSFLRVFDASTEAIKQGGIRRGANMGILRVDHPDILEFITCKNNGTVTNFNISVGITDEFMREYSRDGNVSLINPENDKKVGELSAREIWNKIVDSAWRTGDPGLVFLDRINASPANPVPKLETIEATNPCVIGSTRLSTSRGLVTMDELYATQEQLLVAVDGRNTTSEMTADGSTVSFGNRISFLSATPVYKTAESAPVLKLVTSHGHEIVATPYHKFITPYGRIKLKDLQIGDTLYLQSEEGEWSKDWNLPPFEYSKRLENRIVKGKCQPPTQWSEELGEILGLIVGDGWIRQDNSSLTLGLIISDDDISLVERVQITLWNWFGVKGNRTHRNGCTQLLYKGDVARFFQSLGINFSKAHKKKVPDSVWNAPREAVVGYLRGLFSADGTVNISEHKKTCSVRLSSSSTQMMQDVQQIIGNFGIVSKIYIRREDHKKMMPDSNRESKLYACNAQYELILGKVNRDTFMNLIGFLQDRQYDKYNNFISTKLRGSNLEQYTTTVETIEQVDNEDVYCLTQPFNNEVIFNTIATGQCGEQPLAPHDACNLGSINLSLFVKDSQPADVNWTELERVTRLAVRFLDDLIDVNPYPTEEVAHKVYSNRRIGLGVMGWADMLFQMGLPYSSDDALALGEQVMSFISKVSRNESERLAEVRGPFPNFPNSRYANETPIRNGTVTTIAPTGTISIIADCSSGIEPIFALSFVHKVGERKMSFRNKHVEKILIREGFGSLLSSIDETGSVKDTPLDENLKWLLEIANEIPTDVHVKMQAAFQKYTDNGVSKTINLPNSATREDIADAYKLAWDNGCLGITVFRDGCKGEQVLNVGKKEEPVHVERKDRPRAVVGKTHRLETPVGTAFITVNRDEQGNIFEIFINIGHAGSDVLAMAEALGRLVALNLSAETSATNRERLIDIVDQLKGIAGSRTIGLGPNRISSLPDAIATVLAEELGEKQIKGKADICPSCKNVTFVAEEGCHKCLACGYSMC